MKKKYQVEVLKRLRDIHRSINDFEQNFQNKYKICLNEAMLLCMLVEGRQTSSKIAEKLGLTNSNTSKIIKSVELKGLIKRILGSLDKRQMYFTLTNEGKDQIEIIKCNNIEIPDNLQHIVD